RYEEAIVAYEHARSIDPDHAEAYGLVMCALDVCDWKRTSELSDGLRAHIESGKAFSPLDSLAISDDPSLHLRCAKNHEEKISSRARAPGAVVKHGKIRIAYVSTDFRQHPVSCLIAGLIELHDRTRFEIIGVSIGPSTDDEMRRRLIRGFDQFHDAGPIS